MSTHEQDSFIREAFYGYLECALWSSTVEDDPATGSTVSMDDLYDSHDIASEAYEAMREDVTAFVDAEWDDVRKLDAQQVGHDFWLTRNRHGAGFWDRGLGELGDRLTAAAHVYGSSDLYVGDDGKVYVS
jgi:hypothetical protein